MRDQGCVALLPPLLHLYLPVLICTMVLIFPPLVHTPHTPLVPAATSSVAAAAAAGAVHARSCLLLSCRLLLLFVLVHACCCHARCPRCCHPCCPCCHCCHCCHGCGCHSHCCCCCCHGCSHWALVLCLPPPGIGLGSPRGGR